MIGEKIFHAIYCIVARTTLLPVSRKYKKRRVSQAQQTETEAEAETEEL